MPHHSVQPVTCRKPGASAAAVVAQVLVLLVVTAPSAYAQTTARDIPPATRVVCASNAGERQHCVADTSAGIALERSTGTGPCLLGKTWGYARDGVRVSDGCSGEFVLGQPRTSLAAAAPAPAPAETERSSYGVFDTSGQGSHLPAMRSTGPCRRRRVRGG